MDFVYNMAEIMAVDFNVSPGLKGTGIEPGKEVTHLITEATEYFQ